MMLHELDDVEKRVLLGRAIMTTETSIKPFPLPAVLTVTTGRLLVEMGDVYQILNWITGDELFTHQIPRALKSAAPWLLKCFPELGPVNEFVTQLDAYLADDREGAVARWLAKVGLVFPSVKGNYDITPLPDGWVRMDPRIEAEAILGDSKKMITVQG